MKIYVIKFEDIDGVRYLVWDNGYKVQKFSNYLNPKVNGLFMFDDRCDAMDFLVNDLDVPYLTDGYSVVELREM